MGAEFKISVEVTLRLNEAEARALDALAGYGPDSFLAVFYEHLGKAYMSPHEHGLRTAFTKILDNCRPAIDAASRARKALKE